MNTVNGPSTKLVYRLLLTRPFSKHPLLRKWAGLLTKLSKFGYHFGQNWMKYQKPAAIWSDVGVRNHAVMHVAVKKRDGNAQNDVPAIVSSEA